MTPRAALESCWQALRELADPAGGWPYAPGGPPQVEPTCLALLALLAHRPASQDLLDQGKAALLSWQRSDGSFRVQSGNPMAAWPTSLALLALSKLEAVPSDATRAAAGWLCALEGRLVHQDDKAKEINEIDSSIVGWPWTERTFSWVDPTALGCLALRHAGYGDHPRVREGYRLLLDRVYETGGANAGNRKVFGMATQPVPENTANLVLAFANWSDEPRLAASRRYLLDVALTHEDVGNVAWARIALTGWATEPPIAEALPRIDARLADLYAARHAQKLFAPSVVREAVTALALAADDHCPLVPPPLGQHPAAPQLPQVKPHKPTFSEVIWTGFRGLMVRAVGRMRHVVSPALVQIARAAHYDAPLADLLWEQYAAFRTPVPLKDKVVVLKPNFVEFHRDRVINTHPAVIAAAIELCQREGAKQVIVAEGPGHWRNVEYLVTASGLGEVLSRYGVPFVDLNHDTPVEVPNLGRCTKLEQLYLARTIVEAEVLISMPKLKTHHWAGVTLSLKNLFGTVPGICYGWPKNELHWQGIDNSIVDIALTRTPDLAIVDGIIGMEGDGPLNGEARPVGALVMGTDLLAVDATCCRLMRFDPTKVGHLSLAYNRRLGVIHERDIVVGGTPIAELAQPFVPHERFEHLCLDDRPAPAAAS
jgi:uncharacterized protein (DUF362 family)